jgi:xanthine dehydrogenase YagR molybdenum-binding subunit
MKENDKMYLDFWVQETPKPGEKPKPYNATHVVGKAIVRVDGYERVSGLADYYGDIRLPGMLYGAVVGCPYPRARVNRVDTTKAASMPGVHAVIHASSAISQGKVFWSWYKPEEEFEIFDSHCRYEGWAVAAVAAETPYQAWDAAQAVHVDYKPLPFVTEPPKSLEPGAPRLDAKGNIIDKRQYERGDIGRGFSEADVILEEEFNTACINHNVVEPLGCLVSWDGEELNAWLPCQGVHPLQGDLARAFGLPHSRVRVISHYVGGAFGSRAFLFPHHVITGLLAKETGRPVKLSLSREQEYLVGGNRPGTAIRIKVGAKKDGTLTAVDYDVLVTSGPYKGGTSRADYPLRELYNVANLRAVTTDVRTNADLAQPMRAPGHPQCLFALDQMMDMLAEVLHMDPVELRLKNVPEVNLAVEGLPPFSSEGLKKCITRGAEAFQWQKSRERAAQTRKNGGHIRRGTGMACSSWAWGKALPPSTVVLKLFADGSVNLALGVSDLGTGAKTLMAQVVSEELGIAPELVEIENADTATTPWTFFAGGSKTTPTDCVAVRNAAIQVKQQLAALAAEDLGVSASDLNLSGGEVLALYTLPPTEVHGSKTKIDTSNRIKITDITGLKAQRCIIGVGTREPDPKDMSIKPFAAHFAEVEVNTKTGEVKVVRLLGATDTGRVMNPNTYDNQVFGGMFMGLGQAVMEERILDRGRTGKRLNKTMHDFKSPSIMDAPLSGMTSVPVGTANPSNSVGAIGLGEVVCIPPPTAIANAIYDAIGVRMTRMPMNPRALLEALKRKEG